jgi:hypothetical protein
MERRPRAVLMLRIKKGTYNTREIKLVKGNLVSWKQKQESLMVGTDENGVFNSLIKDKINREPQANLKKLK